MNIRPQRTVPVAVALAAAAALMTGCGSSGDQAGMSDMPGMGSSVTGSPSDGTVGTGDSASMGGMAMAHGDGLSDSADGYTLELKTGLMSGMPMPVRFVITENGTPVTDFRTEQTKRLHFYLIRDDLTGFQHLHPTMAGDGTWSVTVPPVEGGQYRIYTQILPAAESEPLVLSVPVTVPGGATPHPLPAPSTSTKVDGYTVTLDSGVKNHGRLRVSFARDGRAVTDLQPYLETYAHVTAFHEGDMAFTHLHPTNKVTEAGGGPDLDFVVEVPETGTYRLFIQFMTGGTLHTAVITTEVS